MKRLVVGAGLSGLLAARRAVARGERVLVLDAGHGAGGLIAPMSLEASKRNLSIDSGAEAFSTVGGTVERLLIELGLTEQIVRPAEGQARIIAAGKDPYKIPDGYMGIPSSLDDPELSGIFSPLTIEAAKTLDSVDDISSIDLDSATVAELVEVRLGRDFVDLLVDPIVSGVHGASAQNLTAASTMPALVAEFRRTGSLVAAAKNLRGSASRPGSAVASLRGGMSGLIRALTSDLIEAGVEFRFDKKVDSLQEFADFNLTLALPLHQAATLVASTTLGGLLEGAAYRSTDAKILFAVVRSAQLNSHPIGSGALITSDASTCLKAITHVNSKWAWIDEALECDNHVLRMSLRENLAGKAAQTSEVLDEMQRLLGLRDYQVLTTQIVEWPQSLNRPTAEAKTEVQALVEAARAKDIELVGTYISGNGLLGIIKNHYEKVESGT